MLIKNNKITEVNINKCVEVGVKWYSPEMGYGFLRENTDSPDIMIHFSQLDTIGCSYIQEGDRIICEVGPGKNGLQVIRVSKVKFGSSEPCSLATYLTSRLACYDSETFEEIEGAIKWYNPKKGYGFIYLDHMSREAFLPAWVVKAAGYRSLIPGTRVLVKFSSSEKGQEAQTLQVLCEEKEIFSFPSAI